MKPLTAILTPKEFATNFKESPQTTAVLGTKKATTAEATLAKTLY
jgi:hypothetical protein